MTINLFKRINKYKEIAKINFKNSFVYIWDSIFGIAFFVAIIIFVFSQLWTIIFNASETNIISGFTLQMMVWYLVLTEAIVVSLGNIVSQIGTEIRSGEIANYITKPYHYVIYKYAQTIGRGIFTYLLIVLFGGLVAYLTVGGISINWYIIPFVFLISFLAITLNYMIIVNIGLFAFWIEEVRGIYFIYNKFVFIIGGMLVPLEILPLWLAKIGLILPFSYVAYHPAKLLVVFSFKYFLNIIVIQLAWILVFLMISLFVYSAVSKRVSINGG
jgi:ABC-2 type transport system permease protein